MEQLNGKVAVVTGGASDNTGVGVTCLCPGFVATKIISSERNRQ